MTERDDSSTGAAGKEGEPELVPLTEVVDLARNPNGAALAAWYEERIRSGELQAYGFRATAEVFSWRLEPVSTDAWPALAIEWYTGEATPIVATAAVPSSPWRNLHVPDHAHSDAISAANRSLRITTSDARRLVVRWHELSILPRDWQYPEEMFWIEHLDQQSKCCEAALSIDHAVREAGLKALIQNVDGSWSILPPDRWDFNNYRTNLSSGRVNFGATDIEQMAVILKFLPDLDAVRRFFGQDIIESTATPSEGQPPIPEQRWALVFVDFEELCVWYESTDWDTWGAPSQTSSKTGSAAKPGRNPDWPWPMVIAKVAFLVAERRKLGPIEALIEDVRKEAEAFHPDGLEPSRSRAQPFAWAIRDAWEAHAKKLPSFNPGTLGKDKPGDPEP